MLRALTLPGILALAACGAVGPEDESAGADETTNEAEEAASSNFLGNHGFEQKLTTSSNVGNWYPSESTPDDVVTRSTNAARSGKFGLVVSSHDYACGYQFAQGLGGVHYTAHAAARHRTGGSGQTLTMVFMRYDDAIGWQTLATVSKKAGASNSWHSVDVKTLAPQNTQWVGVMIGQCNAMGTSKYNWDSASLVID